MKRAIGTVALVLLVAFAGCSSQNAPPASPSAPIPPEDAGIVEGLVTNDELDPIMGAHVATADGSAEPTVTDDGGRFQLLNVAPGTHVLYVNALGYQSVARSVSAIAGASTSVRIELQPLSTTDPFSVTQSRKGFIACGSGVGTSASGGLTQVTCGAADPNQQFLFNYTFNKGLSGILFEMVWKPTQVLSRDLVLIVEKDGCDVYCESGDTFAEIQGCCTVRVALPVENLTKPAGYKAATDFTEASGRIQTRTFPAFTDEAAATVFTSQDFYIYVEYFYNGLPADFNSRTNVPAS